MDEIIKAKPWPILIEKLPPGEWVALSHEQDTVVAHAIELQKALSHAPYLPGLF